VDIPSPLFWEFIAMTPEQAITIAAPFTLTRKAPLRMQAMAEALQRIDREKIIGDIVECGIWAGGNIILARLLSPMRKCWLYDTFSGMPTAGKFDVKMDGKPGGYGFTKASLNEVLNNLQTTKTFDRDLIHFIPGLVETTLLDPTNRPDRIALLRLDTDFYSSTLAELEHLWPRLCPGGTLIVDDYGHWPGCRRAVDEYFAGAIPQFTMVDYSALMVVKP
jgi:O-methyltransferase